MFNFLKKWRSDRGDSELISFIIVLPFLLGLFVSIIDMSLYIAMDKSSMSSIARDSARSVAIMGGIGDSNNGTPIEVKYGESKATSCSNLSSINRVKDAYRDDMTPIECNMLKSIASSNGLINVHVTKAICAPQLTNAINENVYCTIEWEYSSIPGSPMALFRGIKNNTTSATAKSEVNMSGVNLIPRGN